MNVEVGSPEIGRWYLHRDKGGVFVVTGIDDSSRTVEIQSFDGDIDEIDADTWAVLPLEHAAEPEDWTGPLDDIEPDDLGYSETGMAAVDRAAPLQPFRERAEAWQERAPEEPRDRGNDRFIEEKVALEEPASAPRSS